MAECWKRGAEANAKGVRIEAPRGGEWGGDVPLPNRLGGLGERHELPQRGPGRHLTVCWLTHVWVRSTVHLQENWVAESIGDVRILTGSRLFVGNKKGFSFLKFPLGFKVFKFYRLYCKSLFYKSTHTLIDNVSINIAAGLLNWLTVTNFDCVAAHILDYIRSISRKKHKHYRDKQHTDYW